MVVENKPTAMIVAMEVVNVLMMKVTTEIVAKLAITSKNIPELAPVMPVPFSIPQLAIVHNKKSLQLHELKKQIGQPEKPIKISLKLTKHGFEDKSMSYVYIQSNKELLT